MEISEQIHPFDHCAKQIEEAEDVDAKLTFAIQFMKDALANGNKPRFRDFWRMKKICLDLFKQEIHKTKRVAYWEEYTALLAEAHALQKIIEEQVVFQAEQIDLAIDGLDKEYEKGVVVHHDIPACMESIDQGNQLFTLHESLAFFNRLREQALSYRKEVLSLEIRVSQKNKLLAKLTKVSDKIFPERKRCFQELTRKFLGGVESFVTSNFDKTAKTVREGASYFELKGQIKSFQATLKILMISNDAYGKIRKSLSECWDMLTKAEAKHREDSKKRKEVAPQEIEEELKMIDEVSCSGDYERKLSQIYRQAKSRGVSQEALYLLRKKTSDLREKLEKQEAIVREEQKEKEQKQKDHLDRAYQESLEMLQTLQKKAVRMKAENVLTQLEDVLSMTSGGSLSTRQILIQDQKKQQINLIVYKKLAKAGERVADDLSSLLIDMKEMLVELKNEKRGCGLDIESAFILDELLIETKEAIETLEEQLEELLASAT